ncbi:hypothetical protein AB0B57_22495 [Micromonospora sp. NPDC049101]|uniref:hypothetical protein n=1 Tax=Micromonospora sp. NPDC049101 TaxID=3155032 RepID=UPI0033C417E6
MRFKVGDTVRILKWPVNGHKVGDVGTIAELTEDGDKGYMVSVPGNYGYGWYEDWELEAAAPPLVPTLLPLVPEGMSPDDLAAYVGNFVQAAQTRILGVGADQYARGGRQLFEDMTATALIDMAREEAQDLAVYAAMVDIRLARMAEAFKRQESANA